MISLEQVRQLDIRVKKAVAAVKNLSIENAQLKTRITGLEDQLQNLSNEASSRIADEQELEVSLQGVLDVLDEVDSETSEIDPEPPEDNYVIETVSLDDEGVDSEDPENETDSAPEKQPVSEASGEETTDEEVIADESAIAEQAALELSAPLEDGATSEKTVPEDAEREIDQSPTAAETVSEEVPGVGQVVEFTQPVPEEAVEEADSEETESNEDNSDEEPEIEEVDLSAKEENVAVEDEFQSEFDIF